MITINAYDLLILTNKAKSKFRKYCNDGNIVPIYFNVHDSDNYEYKKIYFFFKVKVRKELPINEIIDLLVKNSNRYDCPIYNNILKYNHLSRLANYNIKMSFTVSEYDISNILEIAEYGNKDY